MYEMIMRIARSKRRRRARSARPAHRRKNLVLDLETFRRDLAAAARAMYGKGRFVQVDDALDLNFSGFAHPVSLPR